MLRQVAEHVAAARPTRRRRQLDRLFDDGFYLPAANKAGHRQIKDAARSLVDRYVDE